MKADVWMFDNEIDWVKYSPCTGEYIKYKAEQADPARSERRVLVECL